MEYIDFSGQAGFQDTAEEIDEQGAQQSHHFDQNVAAYLQDQSNGGYLSNYPNAMTGDIKPRLTKEQADVLEAHFQKQNKPNTNVKKGFAETLGVSLDKINNWFQNRRAKCKQEVKKAVGARNLFAPQASSSDSETSPGYVMPPDYHTMYQQWAADQQASRGLGISQMQQLGVHMQPYQNQASNTAPYQQYLMPQHMNADALESQLDLNRRTLTQEQFDAMEQDARVINGAEDYARMATDFQGSHDGFNQEYDFNGNFKQQDVFPFPHPVGAPLSSNDSTVPSNLSEVSLPTFPASSNMQEHANISAATSEWTGSRSSSIYEDAFAQMPAATQDQHTAASSSQWQPGQSVPVDFNATMEEFRQIQAAQARSSEQQQAVEQPLAWPADDAYSFARRGSSGSMLAQSMGNVELQTPVPSQAAAFKSPVPPSSIAARRQRPKPAQLGMAALRSQSYSGAAGQPGSPGMIQTAHPNLDPGQHLRRIRSSNVVGNVAQGRIMKSGTSSAQRSPLHRSFAEAMNSPAAVRHMSAQTQSSLAPPTPLSPHEFARPEQPRQQFPTWQSASTNATRHASISEMEAEYRAHGLQYQSSSSIPTQHFSSPPHTPAYYQQQFAQPQRFSNFENTPPQSAPAAQSCFPSNIWSQPQSQKMPPPPQPLPQHQQQMMFQAQQYTHSAMPEQQFAQNVSVPATDLHSSVPSHFANGVPVIGADGNIQMIYPSPQLFMQQQQVQTQPQPQQTHTPPQHTYTFTSANGSPNLSSFASAPKPASSELFVHEYTPPDAVKRAATPRKAVDTGPKNYSFSSIGPQDFEHKKAKKGEAKDSSVASGSSPASSIGTVSTS